jgi:hypothetical protein
MPKPTKQPTQPYSLAPHFLARLDAGEFELPDGTLMTIGEMGLRVDKPATLLRFWIATHRPHVYEQIMRERECATARRMRKVIKSAESADLSTVTKE